MIITEQARWAKLSPPVVVDGTAYSVAIRWGHGRGAPSTAPAIVSGQIASILSLGSGYYRVVCARAHQSDSYFLGPLEGGPLEIVFPVLMGGNVAWTHELARLYSWANDRAFRGGDLHDRAQIGDVLVWQGKRFLIIAADSFAHAPSGVGWQGEEHLPQIYYLECDLGVQFTAPSDARARIHYPLDDDGVFADCGLYVEDAGDPGTFLPMDRVVFERPSDSELDEAYLPTDASLDALDYWVDPIGFGVRLGSATASTGNTIAGVYYHRDLSSIETGNVAVLEGEGTGYGTAVDDVFGVACITRADFSQAFFVYAGGTNGFGTGAVEWRLGSAGDASVIGLAWEDGTIVRAFVRDGQGEDMTDLTLDANETPFSGAFFEVRIVKAGGDFSLEWRPEGGGAWTVAATGSLTDVDDGTAGNLRVTTWDGNAVKVLGWPTTAEVLPGVAAGVLSASVTTIWEDVAYSREYTVPGSTSITSVVLHNADDAAMTASSTARRDHYTISGAVVTLTSETAGDRVRVVRAADTGTPSTPGRPPRVPHAINFATMSEVDGVATTDTAENRAHWHDGLTIYDQHGEFAAIAGETFDVERGPGFDPLNPPAYRVDTKSTPTDWGAFPPGAALHFEVENLTLLAQDYVASLDEGAIPCCMADGDGFVQTGGMPARVQNDQAEALDSFDGLWLELPHSGSGSGVYGYLFAQSIVPTGFTCLSCFSNRATSYMFGHLQRFSTFQLIADEGLPSNFWFRDEGTPARTVLSGGSVSHLTTEYVNEAILCCPGTPGSIGYSRGDVGIDRDIGYVRPYGSIGGGGSWVGNIPPGWSFPIDGLAAAFNCNGIGFSDQALGRIARMPAGTVCLEAWMEVTLSSLEFREWTWYDYRDTAASSETVRQTMNGTLFFHAEGGELLVADPVPDPVTTGRIAFHLVGQLLDSGNAHDDQTGESYVAAKHEWVSLQSGIVTGSTIESGKTARVDITGAINALLAARSSLVRNVQLWPLIPGGPPLTADAGTLANYLLGLKSVQSISFAYTDDLGNYRRTVSVSGRLISWSGASFGRLLARFRAPSGVVDTVPLPLIWPAMMPAS